MKKHVVQLDGETREGLLQLSRSGTRPVRVVRRCQILLKSDAGCTDEEIAKQDYEYRRGGTCSVFVAVEPKAGQRFTQARRHRKRADFARFVRDLLRRYPRAERVRLVFDNLNTHNDKSLIQTFGEAAVRPLLDRIEWHDTPKHASWLNLAEIEISAIDRQGLARRLATLQRVQRELSQCSRDRNRKKITINWTFSRKDAKRVFTELYRK